MASSRPRMAPGIKPRPRRPCRRPYARLASPLSRSSASLLSQKPAFEILNPWRKSRIPTPSGPPPSPVLRVTTAVSLLPHVRAALRALERVGVRQVEVVARGGEEALTEHIGRMVRESDMEEPFYLMDVGHLVRLLQAWREALPRVTPFYAVKCSPSPPLVSVLAALGVGFDCASKSEISLVKSLGVEPERIIFANPCKMEGHIKYAREEGVDLTTFDCEGELYKIKSTHPDSRLLLRLRMDDPTARCPLGVKYGALRSEIRPLLKAAMDLELRVVGVAFHVGSGAANFGVFKEAIAEARRVFDEGEAMGAGAMDILDIGGGLTSSLDFITAARAINEALALYFPPEMGVSIIAEPGRYFAESPSTLVTSVFGSRRRGEHREYWINDGLYGSLNCVVFDQAILAPRPLRGSKNGNGIGNENEKPFYVEKELFCSTVFGPTCDSLDTVLRDVWLPEMVPGDWLLFPNMGAYSAASGSSFNGFATSEILTYYVYSMGPGK